MGTRLPPDVLLGSRLGAVPVIYAVDVGAKLHIGIAAVAVIALIAYAWWPPAAQSYRRRKGERRE